MRYLVPVALIALSASANAQQSPARPPAMADTTLVRIGLTPVLEQLARYMIRSPGDTATRAWVFEFPPSPQAPWAHYEEQFMRLLRARPPLPADSIKTVIRVQKVELRGDSIITWFSFWQPHRCGQAWKGETTDYESIALYKNGWWHPARTEAVGFGVSIPCSRPPG